MKLGAMSGAWIRGAVLGAAIVAGTAITDPGPAEAQCVTQNIPGQPRSCTFTEEMRACVRSAVDAYWQCQRDRGWVGRQICKIFEGIDLLACTLNPLRTAKDINPF